MPQTLASHVGHVYLSLETFLAGAVPGCVPVVPVPVVSAGAGAAPPIAPREGPLQGLPPRRSVIGMVSTSPEIEAAGGRLGVDAAAEGSRPQRASPPG